jgi:hypothetical protein
MKRLRCILAVPFILLSALFKITALAMLPEEHREEGEKSI